MKYLDIRQVESTPRTFVVITDLDLSIKENQFFFEFLEKIEGIEEVRTTELETCSFLIQIDEVFINKEQAILDQVKLVMQLEKGKFFRDILKDRDITITQLKNQIIRLREELQSDFIDNTVNEIMSGSDSFKNKPWYRRLMIRIKFFSNPRSLKIMWLMLKEALSKKNRPRYIAIFLFKLGFKYKRNGITLDIELYPNSSSVKEIFISSYGYGKIDHLGEFQYPLPAKYVKSSKQN